MSLFAPAHLIDPKTRKVAIYARKSNKDETGRNKSIHDQVESCKQLMRFLGYDSAHVRVFAEEEGAKGEWWWSGSEGPLPHRPALGSLLEAVSRKEIDTIFTWRSDRLVRSTEVAIALCKHLKGSGIALYAGTRSIDLDTAEGLYSYVIEAASNEKYRMRLGEDITRAHAFKAEMGMPTRDGSCYGFKSAGKGSQRVIPVPEELEIVRTIFRWFVFGDGESGPLGMGQIAKRLMDQGVRIKTGRRGHKAKLPDLIEWGDVKRILKNCMFIGLWRHAGRTFDMDMLLIPDGFGRRDTVVPVEVYEAAQMKLAETRIPGKKALTSEYLLSGLAVCGVCGRNLRVGQQKRKGGSLLKKYRCMGKASTRQGSCPPGAAFGVQVEVFEEWAITYLLPDLRAKIEETRLGGRDDEEASLASLERQLSKAMEKEKGELAGMLGVLDRVQFASLAQHFRAERETLERQISELRSRMAARETRFPDLSDEAVRDMPRGALKDALRRCVKFIATTERGIVVCDAWDQLFAAEWQDVPNGLRAGARKRRAIAAPSVAATLTCFDWLKEPEMFVQGRRMSLGMAGNHLTDEELLPGIEAWRARNGGEQNAA